MFGVQKSCDEAHRSKECKAYKKQGRPLVPPRRVRPEVLEGKAIVGGHVEDQSTDIDHVVEVGAFAQREIQEKIVEKKGKKRSEKQPPEDVFKEQLASEGMRLPERHRYAHGAKVGLCAQIKGVRDRWRCGGRL